MRPKLEQPVTQDSLQLMNKQVNELVKKKTIEVRLPMATGIVDCVDLGEIENLVADLISQHGRKAKVNFDSGHSNISEEIVILRPETDEEVNLRIDQEINTLVKKQKAAKQQADQIDSRIKALSDKKT
jgi:hypothetical protein